MGLEQGPPFSLNESKAHVVQLDVVGGQGLGDSSDAALAVPPAAAAGAGLHMLRLHPARRTQPPLYGENQEMEKVEVQQGQEQYHHQQERLFQLQQEYAASTGSRDEETAVGGAGSVGGKGHLLAPPPLSPTTPATRRHNSRLANLSMLLLVFQGTALSITLRYSRARAGQPYLASVSVIVTEVIKLVICVAMQLRISISNAQRAAAAGHSGSSDEEGGDSSGGQQQQLLRELKRQARDIAAKSLPMMLPAGMFVMQQVLLIIAASHLDAVAFQIFSQSFKLVPTALFSYWLLGQMLEPMQWASIPVLAAGVIFVTLNNGGSTAHQSAAAAAVSSSSSGLDYVAGMVACSISGLSSAYAGVYFEKYVKGKHAASLWVRNIQLGIFGVPLSTAYAVVKDGGRIRTGGLMQGFDWATWAVIALQVFGGLVTGMVVKYCDNILKNFALAISVILTVLVAIPLFGQWPSTFFLVGVSLVLLSVFMYGRALDPQQLQLWWQWACKRMMPWRKDDGSRSRRLLLVFLLASAAAMLVLGGRLTSGSQLGGLPLHQGDGGSSGAGAAALHLPGGMEGSGGAAATVKPALAAVGRGGDDDSGLRRNLGQLLKEGAAQQQLLADSSLLQL